MDNYQQRQVNQEPASAFADIVNRRDNTQHAEQVDPHQKGVIYVEKGFLPQESISQVNQSGENGSWVEGVRQPILLQKADPCLSCAMQEILILIRGIKWGLSVGDGENGRYEKECGCRLQPAFSLLGWIFHNLTYNPNPAIKQGERGIIPGGLFPVLFHS